MREARAERAEQQQVLLALERIESERLAAEQRIHDEVNGLVPQTNNVIILSRRDMVYAFPSMRRLPQASSPAHVEPGASVTTIDV